MTLPSFRDLELRLQRITDVPDIAADLRRSAALFDRFDDPAITAMAKQFTHIAGRITELHFLCTALWHTVRNFGTPPAAPPRADSKQPARSIHAPQRKSAADMRPAVPLSPPCTRVHRHQLDDAAGTAAPVGALPRAGSRRTGRAAPRGPVAVQLAPDQIRLATVLQLTGRSEPWLYAAMQKSGFPRPSARIKNRVSVWSLAAVQAWIHARQHRPGTGAKRGPKPRSGANHTTPRET